MSLEVKCLSGLSSSTTLSRRRGEGIGGERRGRRGEEREEGRGGGGEREGKDGGGERKELL